MNENQILKDLLLSANELLRSALSIATRRGEQTNWDAFKKRVAEELEREHPITGPMYGERARKMLENTQP